MLKFEDWIKLPDKEKEKKYKELSKEDKFKVRMGFYCTDYKHKHSNTKFKNPELTKINEYYDEIIKGDNKK